MYIKTNKIDPIKATTHNGWRQRVRCARLCWAETHPDGRHPKSLQQWGTSPSSHPGGQQPPVPGSWSAVREQSWSTPEPPGHALWINP